MAIEAKRGCGYRKVGGIYLVSGNYSEPCHRLPIPLHVCPTCHGGIKQSRGWTWVEPAILGGRCDRMQDPNPLAALSKDTDAERHCVTCVTCAPELFGEKAGLLWIGEKFYPTPHDFQAEADAMGISRRVSKLPKNFKLGESWVILAHPKAVPTECVHDDDTAPTIPNCDHEPVAGTSGKFSHYVKTPGIFTAFKPIRVEKLITESQSKEEGVLADLEKKGVTPIVVPDNDKDHQGSVYGKSEDDDLFEEKPATEQQAEA